MKVYSLSLITYCGNCSNCGESFCIAESVYQQMDSMMCEECGRYIAKDDFVLANKVDFDVQESTPELARALVASTEGSIWLDKDSVVCVCVDTIVRNNFPCIIDEKHMFFNALTY